MAAQLAAGQDLVGAHPPQRRRIRVDRHRRARAGVAHAVDVGGAEVERLARARTSRVTGGPPSASRSSATSPCDHRDRAAGEVVVVKARCRGRPSSRSARPRRRRRGAAPRSGAGRASAARGAPRPAGRRPGHGRGTPGRSRRAHSYEALRVGDDDGVLGRGAERREGDRLDHRAGPSRRAGGRRRRRAASRRSRAGRRTRCRRRSARSCTASRRPAAGGEPLGVQRREPGEHREDDPQRRVRRPPPLRPRVPGGRHLGDVGGQRRETRRASRRPGRDGRTAAAPLRARRSSAGPRLSMPAGPPSAPAGRERPTAPASRSASTRAADAGRRARGPPTARTARPARARRGGSRRAAPRPPAARLDARAGSTARSGSLQVAARARARPGHASRGSNGAAASPASSSSQPRPSRRSRGGAVRRAREESRRIRPEVLVDVGAAHGDADNTRLIRSSFRSLCARPSRRSP